MEQAGIILVLRVGTVDDNRIVILVEVVHRQTVAGLEGIH